MAIETKRYVRKPLYVEAVRITLDNFNEITTWCQGKQQYDPPEAPNRTGKKYIKVRVHSPKNIKQTKAYIGDWLLYTDLGYKIYTHKAFESGFDEVKSENTPLIFIDPDTGFLTDKSPSEESKALLFDEIMEIIINEIHSERHYTRIEAAKTGKPDPISPGLFTEDEMREKFKYSRIDHLDDEEAHEKIEPSAAEGKHILSIDEQRRMTADEIRDLVQSGKAVLAQDIASS